MPPEAPFTVNPGGFALLLWIVILVVATVFGGVLAWLARRGFKQQVANLDLIPTIAAELKEVRGQVADVQSTQTSQSGAISALHTRMDKMSEQSRRQEVRTAERFARIETKLSLDPLAADDDSGQHAPVGS